MSVTVSTNLNNQHNDYSARGALSSSSVNNDARVLSGNNVLAGFKAGSTLSGEVVSRDNNQITLKLSNNQMISAKLDGNADISVGQKLTFEVSRNGSNQTMLRPLFANLASDSAVAAAIKAANLPMNSMTISMTGQMMKEGLPVNTNALTEMARIVATHSASDPAAIVQMTKIGMPLTETNISQFENYKNFEHHIVNDVNTVGEEIAGLLKEFGGVNTVESLGRDITLDILNLVDTTRLDIMSEEDSIDATGDLGTQVLDQEGIAGGAEDRTNPNVLQNLGSFLKNVVTDVFNNEGNNVSVFVPGTENNDSNISDMSIVAEAGEAAAELSDIADNNNAFVFNPNLPLDENSQKAIFDSVNNILSMSGKEEITSPINAGDLLDILKGLYSEYISEAADNEAGDVTGNSSSLVDGAVENAASVESNNSTITSLLKQVSETANGEVVTGADKEEADLLSEDKIVSVKQEIKNGIKNILQSDEFGKLVKESVKAQMTLRPEEVADSKKIEELYQRILKTTDKVNELANNIGRDNPELLKSTTNLADNVNFMNELNQFVNYVQLPLKMAGEDAHGELFVYTKRKSLENNDGNFSALLHLDMDHLGPMDVHVAMSNYTNVNTHFYLQTDELLDFIAEHLDELNKRLEEKGYNSTINATKKGVAETVPMTDEFVKDERGTVSSVVSKVCFDVRA